MSDAPWTFGESVAQRDGGGSEQERIEGEVRQAYRAFGRAKKLYAIALATEIMRLKASGVAVTACMTLAQGDERIAELREAKDIAEGVKESAKVAAWRANKDRDDTNALIQWSMRRELAEGYAPPQGPGGQIYGGRRAA